jgi:hypothetical protein
MSTIHPHWHSTDEASVPVRVSSAKTNAPVVGHSRISRRPAAVLGIMLALAVGAVSYGTFDDAHQGLTGAISPGSTPKSAFDILADQMQQEASDRAAEQIPQSFSQERAAAPGVTKITGNPAPGNAAIPTNVNAVSADVGERMHSAAPRPITQPESGAEILLLTFAGAAGGLWVTARRQMTMR